MTENDVVGGQLNRNFLRAETDAVKNVNASVSAKASVEYLPNIVNFSDFKINSELSIAALVSDLFFGQNGLFDSVRQSPARGSVRHNRYYFHHCARHQVLKGR